MFASVSHQNRSSAPFSNTLFGEKYLILEQFEAAALYKCINKDTRQDYVCKVVPTVDHQQYLTSYMILKGHAGINVIEDILVGPEWTYVLFTPHFGDLHSYVRNAKRLKEPEAAKLFYQIASIVAHCHRNGIVLRDLKLRKFVFADSERSVLKLETLDDAVVLRDSEDDRLCDKHGCPAYVSPEIIHAVQGYYSGRTADCWSLGVILFTMLVGRYPFHDDDPSLLFSKIRRGSFNIPNSLSPLAKCVIRSLLRKNPSERLTVDDLLDCKWFKLMGSPSSNYCKFHLTLNCETTESTNRNPLSLSCHSPYLLEDKLPADQTVPDSGFSEYSASSSFFNLKSFQLQHTSST